MVRLNPSGAPDSPAARIARAPVGDATILLDGATGTELRRRGAAMHSEVRCAMATLEAPANALARSAR